MDPDAETHRHSDSETLPLGDQREAEPAARRFGPYDIIRELGRGAQGAVFLARHRRLGSTVALKIMVRSALSEAHRLAFEREAVIASRLDHPGLASVHDFGYEDGAPYIAMRYVRGESLAARLRRLVIGLRGFDDSFGSEARDGTDELRSRDEDARGRPATRDEIMEMVEIVERCARSMHDAHEANLVHRDLKPGNIMIGEDGRPVVVDFGLARDVEESDSSLGGPGRFAGTVPYMAPELLSSVASPPDRRTDIYALGVTLFECLTLKRPFSGAHRAQLCDAILTQPAPWARRTNPKIPYELDVVLQCALERDRDRRYATATAFAEDLARVRRREPIVARPLPRLLKLSRWIVRRPARAAIVGLFLPALLVVGGLWIATELRARGEAERFDDVLGGWGVLKLADEVPLVASSLTMHERLLARADALLAREAELHGESSEDLAETREILDGVREVRPRLVANLARVRGAARVWNESAKAWETAIAAIAADPRYGGLGARLTPQRGVVPLRRNETSGFWEFWVPVTGRQPELESGSGAPISHEDDAIVLVLLPGARTTLGSPPGERGRNDVDGNENEFAFDVAPFFVGATEVTKAQWRRICGDDPSGYPVGLRFESDAPVTSIHPVENVDWSSARAFCARIGLVLPTEVQWEYASRAGRRTRFHFGDDVEELDDYANVDDGRFGGLSDGDDGFRIHGPVTAFEPNAFGLYGVHGNVSEWCLDVYVARQEDANRVPGTGEVRAPRARTRAFRGGSYHLTARYCRAAFRHHQPAHGENFALGLRVARPLR